MNIFKCWIKTLATFFVIGGCAALSLRAEIGASPPDGSAATNLVAKITERLKLTEDQRVKAQPILQVSFDKRRAILEKYRGQTGFRALRSLQRELEPIRKETDDKLKGVLTSAQMKELEKIRVEMKKQWRDNLRAKKNNAN